MNALFSVLGAVCGCVLSALADDAFVTLTAGDALNESSFVAAGHWSDGLAPSAEKDYLVDNWNAAADVRLRTPDANDVGHAFAGRSLTLGNPVTRAPGSLLFKTTGVPGITVDNLRLVAGRITLGSNGAAHLSGRATVLSPASDPFLLEPFTNRTLFVHSTLVGGSDAALRVVSSSPCELQLLGDSSETYFGAFQVGANATLVFQDERALGGGEVTLDGGALRGGAHGASAGAVNVTAAGGTLWTRADAPWRVAGPLAGNGVLTVRGEGEITLAGRCACAGVTVAEAGCRVTLGTDFVAAGGMRIEMADGLFSVAEAGADLVLTNLVFSGGGYLARTARNRPTARLDLESASWTQPVRVGFLDGFPSEEPPVAVMSFPQGQSPRPEDFIVLQGDGATSPTNLVVRVRDEAETGRTVVLLDWTAALGAERRVYADAADTWTDAASVRAGVHYTVDACELRATAGTPARTYVFPGASLRLVGTTASRGRFVSKHGEAVFADLQGGAYAGYGFGDGATTQTLAGALWMEDVHRDGRFVFAAGADGRHCRIASRISGGGWIRFLAEAYDAAGLLHYELVQTNGDYRGGFEVGGAFQNGVWTDDHVRTWLHIADAVSLGGEPARFLDDAVALRPGGGLWVERACALTGTNRGLTLDGPCAIHVPTGERFSVRVPATLSGGVVRKSGGGTLELFCVQRVPNARPVTVRVEEGTLRAFAPGELPPGVAVEVAAGAAWKRIPNGFRMVLR